MMTLGLHFVFVNYRRFPLHIMTFRYKLTTYTVTMLVCFEIAFSFVI